ncbi:MAG: hypothetical protein ACOX68_08550 [Candidatus Limivicinus sp.]|jgi:hypothetical protein
MLKIRKGGHKDLQKYYGLLEVDFDKRELLSKLAIHGAMMKGNMEMLIVYDDENGMDLGYAITFCRSLYGYVLLKYLAVMPWFRGKGMGVECMRLIDKYYADRQGILAEVLAFEDEDGSYVRKLEKFFGRFGFETAESDYRIGGTEVELMVKPIKGTAEISPVYHRIINDFYSRCLSPMAMDSMIDVRPVKK